MPIEFHCHTLFSVDGHGSPEEVVETAVERGVSVLALTEHNNLDSYSRAAAHAEKQGIHCLAGIEFDARWNGNQLHFLALGVDPENANLKRLCQRHLAVYSGFAGLIREAMEKRGFPVSGEELLEDYSKRYPTHPSPTPNLWHLRDFYFRKGYFPDQAAANEEVNALFREIKKQHPSIAEAIGSFDEVNHTVRQAGGVFLLAHVATYMPGNAQGQLDLIAALLDRGVDGFELYHPNNCAEAHFGQLKCLAEKRKCLVSGGSDSHRVPGRIGECGAPDAIVAPLLEAIGLRSGGK